MVPVRLRCHPMRKRLARRQIETVTFRNEFGELVSDHFVIRAAEHFFRRRIHRMNHALLVDRDHAVENVIDDRSDACLGAFEFRQLFARERDGIPTRNNQEGRRKRARAPSATVLIMRWRFVAAVSSS